MSLLELEPVVDVPDTVLVTPPTEVAEEGPAQGLVLRAGVAGALSTASAAWVVGGLFDGRILPRAIALLGVLIGCGITAVSFRTRRPGAVQWAVLPVAALAGAALVAPSASGGSANLPGLVAEAVSGGGLLQTPLPFDPGWRFLLVVVLALVGSAAVGLACVLGKPRVAVALPLPLALGAATLQPTGGELVTGGAAVVLAVAALAVAFGAELRGEGDRLGSGFELRRFLRAAGLLVILLAVLAALARTDALFPDTKRDRVLPPQRPPQVPLEPDRELFRVTGADRGPWRVGVLDSYDGAAWLLPPTDRERLQDLGTGGVLHPDAPAVAPVRTVFDIVDLRGAVLPIPAGTERYDGPEAQLDPRVETLVLPARVDRGARYTVSSVPTAEAKELDGAPPAPADLAKEFTEVPPVPSAVAQLLAIAPTRPFQRLQFLRDTLFANVVAAGSGSPVEVSPARVDQLLAEKDAEATPYEITAAEALLARWSGLPARIGFGYYSGDARAGGFSIRPKHGAAWLEVYFTGKGWVPLVGTPPRAKSSLDATDQRSDPRVTPSEELALLVYVPVQEDTFLQLFQVVRYWLGRAVLAALVLGTAYVFYAAACRSVRRRRRMSWAEQRGPAGRVLVAYAELRDGLIDLGVSSPADTPLELSRRFVKDPESEDLAWLVTRVLWGDLRRDVRPADAAEAERLCRSVLRRAVGARSLALRSTRLASRASLKEPWTQDLPGCWPVIPVRALRTRLRAALRRTRRSVTGGVGRLRPQAAAFLVVLGLLSGCAQQAGLDGASSPVDYPSRIVPEAPGTILGYRFEREPSAESAYERVGGKALVSEGRVWTVRSGQVVEGSVQVALLRKDLDGRDSDVQADVESGIGGTFRDEQVGFVRLRTRDLPEQRMYLWFPPERNVMILMIFRKQLFDGPRLARGVVAYIRGIQPELLADLPGSKKLTAVSPELRDSATDSESKKETDR